MSEDLDFKVFGRSLKTQEITKKITKSTQESAVK